MEIPKRNRAWKSDLIDNGMHIRSMLQFMPYFIHGERASMSWIYHDDFHII
jgi:hypothetical protein